MKNIGDMRSLLGYIYTHRNLAVNAIDARNQEMLDTAILNMEKYLTGLKRLVEEQRS